MSNLNEDSEVLEEFKAFYVAENDHLDRDIITEMQWGEVKNNFPELLEEAERRVAEKNEKRKKARDEVGKRIVALEEEIDSLKKNTAISSDLTSFENKLTKLEKKLKKLERTGFSLKSRKGIEEKFGIEFPIWITKEESYLPTYEALLALRGFIFSRKGAINSVISKIGDWESELEKGNSRKTDYYKARHEMMKLSSSMGTWREASEEYYRLLTGSEDYNGNEVSSERYDMFMDLVKEGRSPMRNWGPNDYLVRQINDFLHSEEEVEKLKGVM